MTAFGGLPAKYPHIRTPTNKFAVLAMGAAQREPKLRFVGQASKLKIGVRVSIRDEFIAEQPILDDRQQVDRNIDGQRVAGRSVDKLRSMQPQQDLSLRKAGPKTAFALRYRRFVSLQICPHIVRGYSDRGSPNQPTATSARGQHEYSRRRTVRQDSTINEPFGSIAPSKAR
jgi:hypothetical protein